VAFVGLSAFHVLLVLLVLLEGRFLVRAPGVLLAGGLALSAAGLVLTAGEMPALANLARVALAVFLGCLIARAMERVWWVVPVAAAISVVDVWSVFAEQGITRKALEAAEPAESGEQGGTGWLAKLFFEGPPLDGPLYVIGTTDLVFSVVFLGVAHMWRLPLLRTLVALVAGVAVGFAIASWYGIGIPMLPFLALAFIVVHGRLLLTEVRDAVRPAGGAGEGAAAAAPSKRGGARQPA
jgi:hypothetical protein